MIQCVCIMKLVSEVICPNLGLHVSGVDGGGGGGGGCKNIGSPLNRESFHGHNVMFKIKHLIQSKFLESVA